jgi:hypothetical protein
MRKITQLKSAGALAGIAMVLGSSPAGALPLGATADVHVVASTVVPLSVPGASLGVRPTTVGPVEHDGQILTLPAFSAAVPVSVDVRVHAEAAGAAMVAVTTSNPATAVSVTESRNALGQRCFGLGVDFTADVSVSYGPGLYLGTTAKANAAVTVKVGDAVAFDYATEDIALNHGETILPQGHHEAIPVVTGADVCLPVEVDVPVAPTVSAVTTVVTRIGLG